MSYIVDFIKELSGIIGGLLQFLLSLVKGLLNLIQALPSYLNQLTTCVGYLPEVLITWFGIGITVTVIFLVLGRRDGGD